MKGFTRKEFIEHLASKTKDWELVGEYTNALTRTEFLHKPCGHTYLKTPYNVTSKPHMCQFCNADRLRGKDAFLKKVRAKVDYEVLGEYKNNRTKILIRHKVCGKTFETAPYNFIKTPEGCPHCVGKTIANAVTWTHERFLQEAGERCDEYEFLEEYKNFITPIRVRHIPCGEEFKVTPCNFLRGSRCPSCKYSTGEGQVYRWLRKLLPLEVIEHDTRTLLAHGRELDIWFPDRKFAIEYDGTAFHNVDALMRSHPKWTEQEAANYHKWKTDECEKQGIRLVHIFEDEWLEHREIVEDKLRAIFKCPMERLYARKLKLAVIPKSEARDFLKKNHIQGPTKTVISVGLYNGERLVAVQSFARYTRAKKINAWELVRYATELGVQVVGGFSRCLKWFEREYTPNEVISFADRRWCDPFSNVYKANGFIKDAIVPKSYWYVKPPKRFHKSGFRKSKFKKKYPKIYSPDKTEKQMAQEAKLHRMYDCGLIRYSKRY